MKKYTHVLSMLALGIITFSIIFYPSKVEESFTYFPIDRNASFLSAETTLTLLEKTGQGYQLLWRTSSTLDRKAYLRQDISLLYANGKLIDKIGDNWKQKIDKISLQQKVSRKESANFKAISFHHAEIHADDEITSAQRITHDELYVLDSSFSPLHSFHQPVSQEEKEWKMVIDQLTNQQVLHALQIVKKDNALQEENYTAYWLTDLYQFEDSPLPGFTETETKEILGRLWEGLYKNYFLGIKKKDGTLASPIGSTIPLVLVAKDRSHLLVISQLDNNGVMLLQQQIINLE